MHRLRRLMAFLLTFLSLVATTETLRADSHSDPDFHYKLELPEYWVAMTPQELEKINAAARQRIPGKAIQFVTGFRSKFSSPGSYPYVLVAQDAYSMSGKSYDTLQSEMEKQLGQGLKQLEGSPSEIMKSTKIGSATLDRTRNRAVVRGQISSPGVGTVEVLTVLHIGANGVIAFHCYGHESDFDGNLPIFEKINDSFKFDDGYEFKPGGILQTATRLAIVVAGIGGVVGIGVFVARKFRQRGM